MNRFNQERFQLLRSDVREKLEKIPMIGEVVLYEHSLDEWVVIGWQDSSIDTIARRYGDIIDDIALNRIENISLDIVKNNSNTNQVQRARISNLSLIQGRRKEVTIYRIASSNFNVIEGLDAYNRGPKETIDQRIIFQGHDMYRANKFYRESTSQVEDADIGVGRRTFGDWLVETLIVRGYTDGERVEERTSGPFYMPPSVRDNEEQDEGGNPVRQFF